MRAVLPGRADADRAVIEARLGEASRLIDEGNAIEDAGRLDLALKRYEAAVSLAPDLPRAHLNRGNILLAQGDAEAALVAYATAAGQDPGYVAAYFNAGNAHARVGRHEAAIDAYRRALALKPDLVEAELAMGNALEDLGRLEDAVASFRSATRLSPDSAEAHYNLASPLHRLGRLDEAAASYRRALQIRPGYVQAHNNLGIVLEEMLLLADAEASYRRALDFEPGFATAFSNLLFCLSHDEVIGPEVLYAEHCRFGQAFEEPLRGTWPRHANSREPARRLRVGFVSGDLRDHAVAHFIEPILKELAGMPGLSAFAYYNHRAEGHMTPRLRALVEQWHPVAELSDEALAMKIASDRIDILVDLSGHTGANRLLTFARKPAPVQVSWIGYPATTGLAAMDYYLADHHFLPPGDFDAQFTEKLVYLPASAPFVPGPTPPPVNALPALGPGLVTFGSFNRVSKASRSVVALWSRLLRQLPDARMLLAGLPPNGKSESLVEWFAAEGVRRERLEFCGRCDLEAYLLRHHQVDICLDTFPYTGGTTTFHALWMGVPTLTLAGRTAPGRQGAAILGQVGLGDFVAIDADEFVERGMHWAHDLAALGELRAGLRARCERSLYCRPDLIAAGLDRALRRMWQRWCAGLPAESIDVSVVSEPSAAEGNGAG
jgi:predicted O-linked N-acetylglucosamine transferase (SPINDLY family)